ncbi:MAG TPA: phosphatase PAP2 family protein, partial [Alphaproteobacteria bacterium]|nr:phosphatase PAP2 family protein [Alphaproteobacteria bacterium]
SDALHQTLKRVIDLWAANVLYLGKGQFLLSNSELSRFFHKPVDMTLKYGFIGALVIYLGLLAAQVRIPETIKSRLNFVFITVFTSVLMIINVLFKEFWGRARPSQITEFGGKADFTAAWQVTNQCQSNCAFTSGHAGIAACLALLAVFLPAKYRMPYLIFAVIFYAVASFMRMARGAHFLSDVTISGFVVLVVAMLVKDILRLRL